MNPQNFTLAPPEEVTDNHSMNMKAAEHNRPSAEDQGHPYSLVVAQITLVLGALFMFIIWFSMAIMEYKPLNSLDKVYINTELSPQELRTINLALTGGSSVAEKQQNLQNIPWVRQATVSRKLSGTTDILMIDLEKAEPIAMTRKGKLLFSDGKLIENQATDYDVPVISGAIINGAIINDLGAQTNKGKGENSRGYGDRPALGETITAFSKLSSSYGLDIVEYKVSPTGAVDVLLAGGGMVKIGIRNHDERLQRLSRFLSSYGNRIAEVKNIDLRHSKGLAVSWSS